VLFVQYGCQTGCQTRLTTALTTGWMFVYTIQPVVKPVVQPLYNRFDNRLYRVNGVLVPLKSAQQYPKHGPFFAQQYSRYQSPKLALVPCFIHSLLFRPPFPQVDIIGAMVIVWRIRGKIVRSVLCNIVCNNCAQCSAHTYEQTSSSLD